MNAIRFVSEFFSCRAATMKATARLASSLLVLLLVIGNVACGQTSALSLGARPASNQHQQCVPVGRDACYQFVSDGQPASNQHQQCVPVGRDSCYQFVSKK